jgi:hypothetical protein
MWFYIPAIILVILVAVWVRRTNMYRQFRSGRGTEPGQSNYGASAQNWEGPPGNTDIGGPGAG